MSKEMTDLMAEYHEALAEFERDDNATDDRHMAACDRILAARPTEPIAMAAQVRWLAEGTLPVDREDERNILEHVAERLEAMTPPRSS